jgi:hypothetical protein
MWETRRVFQAEGVTCKVIPGSGISTAEGLRYVLKDMRRADIRGQTNKKG